MTRIEEARKLLEEIRSKADDDEEAHGLEDNLYVTVLGWIAEGDPDAKELAAIALEAGDIEFARWCA